MLHTSRNSILLPSQIVQLGDGSSLTSFNISNIQSSHQKVITPHMFTHQMNLEPVNLQTSLIWPVPNSSHSAIFNQRIQHHHNTCTLLPDHFPKTHHRFFHWSLSHDILTS